MPNNSVVVNSGKLLYLADLVAGKLAGARAGLFTNNVIPGPLTVLGDFVEPTWAGYARLLLAGWTAPALLADFSAVTRADLISWLKTDAGAASVYGWFKVSALGALLDAARFGGAPLAVEQGKPFPLAPTFGAQSLI